MATAYELAGIMVRTYTPNNYNLISAMTELNNMRRNNYAVAVDFDGTLVVSEYPEIGAPNTDAIDRLKILNQWGVKVILWTCRTGEELEAAKVWCAEQGITLDAVNENTPTLKAKWGNDPRKVGAGEYWDDRAVCVSCKPVEGASVAGGGEPQ